ncbi:hypothetical protein BpHYR1_004564 [Brachionus plicatilis]|uniref:Uncharacterized protein n=1 Tax=Brachionus plicatilis TaxID=10195 RepID=A0A3M7P9X9_BRAPC|nr:hypothetical protein BpHYR1_004564 [Brachionus plicatilis]
MHKSPKWIFQCLVSSKRKFKNTKSDFIQIMTQKGIIPVILKIQYKLMIVYHLTLKINFKI